MKPREHTLSSGRVVYIGRNETNNDELVEQTQRNETMLHTKAPGSPFINAGEKPTKKELQEAAVICAKYSQDWRDNKQNVQVQIFLRANMKKTKGMKTGSWNVHKTEETITAQKKDIQKLEQELQQHNSNQ